MILWPIRQGYIKKIEIRSRCTGLTRVLLLIPTVTTSVISSALFVFLKTFLSFQVLRLEAPTLKLNQIFTVRHKLGFKFDTPSILAELHCALGYKWGCYLGATKMFFSLMPHFRKISRCRTGHCASSIKRSCYPSKMLQNLKKTIIPFSKKTHSEEWTK